MLISVNRHSKRPPNNFGGLVDCFGSFIVGDLTLLNSIKNLFKWCAQQESNLYLQLRRHLRQLSFWVFYRRRNTYCKKCYFPCVQKVSIFWKWAISPLWQFGDKACYNLAKVFSEYAVRAGKSSVKIGGKVIIRESLTTFKRLFSNLHMF